MPVNFRFQNPAVVLAAAVLCVAVSGCADESRAQIVESGEVYEFGLQRQGTVLDHTFVWVNATGQPKEVREVRTTCGCTAAQIKAGTVIPPGERLELPVTLRLAGKKDDVESKVYVFYKGEESPQEFVLRGTVAAEYPETVALGSFRRNEPVSSTVTLETYPGQPPLEIKELQFDDRKLEVTSRQGARPGSFDIMVKPAKDIDYGHLESVVVVHTNDSEVPEKSFAVKGDVLRRLEISTKVLRFEPAPDGTVAPAEVVLESPYGEPLELLSVDNTRPKRFAWEELPDAEPTRRTVRVSVVGDVPPSGRNEFVRGALTFQVRVGDEEETAKVDLYLRRKFAVKPALTAPADVKPDPR
ncbi:MAG: hypothetical protein AMXMBFR4_26430 [Candidatus Hydrogenedentota bacterium]